MYPDNVSREVDREGFGEPSCAAAEVENVAHAQPMDVRFESAHPKVECLGTVIATKVIRRRDGSQCVIHAVAAMDIIRYVGATRNMQMALVTIRLLRFLSKASKLSAG